MAGNLSLYPTINSPPSDAKPVTGTSITGDKFAMDVAVVNNPFTTITNTRPTVTTTSSIILAANTSRKSAIIFNQSGGVVYFKLGATAIANEGIRLANNEKFEINATNLFTGDIHAIRGAGSSVIDVAEGT